MFRYVLRRAIWAAPTLLFITLLAFALIAYLGAPSQSTTERDTDELPRFLNSHPRDLRSLSHEALERIALNRDPERGRQILTRLGACAFPYVLPELDALSPSQRTDVALALQPVATRMGIASTNASSDSNEMIVFWQRFWEERSIDFKPTVVRRAVRRLGSHDTQSRRDELYEFDTYALEFILIELELLQSTSEVAKAARLIEAASHATGRDDRIAVDATPQEMRRCIARWQEWWLSQRADYVSLVGTDRITALLVETQYGHWALQAVTLRLGAGNDGAPVVDTIINLGRLTLARALCALVVAYMIAIPAGLISAFRLRSRVASLARPTGILITGIASLLATPLLPYVSSSLRQLFTVAVCSFWLVWPISRSIRLNALIFLKSGASVTARAKGLSDLQLIRRHMLAHCLAPSLGSATADLALLLSAVCTSEIWLGLRGIGPTLLQALAHRDLPFLMAFALASAICVMLMNIATDLMSAWLDVRFRSTLLREPL
jgi:ABC-type dipeptide/oligopeptide/nickel transport system permease component